MEDSRFAFIPPLTDPPFGEGGCQAGPQGLLEIIKIYASVCKHTFKSWRFPSAGIFKLQSRSPPSQSFICVTDRPLMAGLPGAVHYAFASSLCRTQKVLSGLGTQNTLRPPTPLIRGWGLPAANRLETQGWGGQC